MNKLKLDLDQLTVDSFDTAAPIAPRGTVFGEQCSCETVCSCPGCPTCDASCNGSCEDTCLDSCWGSCAPEYSCWDTCAGQYTCESRTGDQIICQC